MLYTVMKDGKALKELKTLAAAKKLAEAENALVLYEGEVVYRPTLIVPSEEGATVEKTAAAPYRLTHLMNVRSAPSMEAQKVGVLSAGTTVQVKAVENDWLCLCDGTFILYQSGTFAEKVN